MAGGYDDQTLKKYEKTYRDTIALSRKYLQPGHHVLDFACGTGIITVELAGSVSSMLAIDLSGKMIEIARHKSEQKKLDNVTCEVRDLFDPALNAHPFDAVCAFNILYFIKDIDRVLDRIFELLTPSGVFLSATDCIGDVKSLLAPVYISLSRIGILPYMQALTCSGLETSIQKHGFSILETKDLYHFPPNYFIAAQKTQSQPI
jgi:ubiquinone/menaquinone biosynthesis C-methylase UbiE